MALIEIRETLLSQHRAVRAKVEEARARATRAPAGEGTSDALRECLQALVNQLDNHNAYEERALKEILPSVDAWGPVRLDVMTAEHIEEHRNLSAALLDAAARDDRAAGAAEVVRLLDAMLQHMVREEEIILAADVLTDDITVRDTFGG
jgi:hypothetical protein